MPNVEKVVFILKIPKCLRIYVRLNIQVFEFFFSDVKPEVEFKTHTCLLSSTADILNI